MNKEQARLDEIRPVLWYDRYDVSSNGDVYNHKTGAMLIPAVNRYGYKCVVIRNELGRKNIPVHRLVALTFIPNPNGYEQVNHIDEDKLNNRVENLEWCNLKYNVTYGSAVAKRAASQSKGLWGVEISTGLTRRFSSVKQAEIELGVFRGNISNVCNGKRGSTGGYLFYYAAEPKGDEAR